MKSKLFMMIAFLLMLLTVGCTTSKKQILHGFYQSEHVNGYVIQMSFQSEDNMFTQYIDNIEVNKGTYEILEGTTYILNGNEKDLTITTEGDFFNVDIDKLNDGEPIKLSKIDNTPTYFDSEFSNEEKDKIKNLFN